MMLKLSGLRRLLPVLAVAIAAATPACAEGVALTFDDLPTLSISDSAAYAKTTTDRLTAGLAKHHVPAIGLVIGDRFEDQPKVRDALLRTWLSHGLELGNHTWSHESLNKTPAAEYVAEIARTDAELRARLHIHPHWFRHPYLETGSDEAARTTVMGWLARHDYRQAPVTLENGDDTFATPYDDAVLRGDKARQAEVKAAYLAYTERSVVWYRQAAFALLGRRPALIFLMHASRLNADSLDGICAILKRNGLTPVSLERAIADTAYALPDGPPDANGDDWLNRWAGLLHADLPWDSFPEIPKAIEDASRALDNDP